MLTIHPPKQYLRMKTLFKALLVLLPLLSLTAGAQVLNVAYNFSALVNNTNRDGSQNNSQVGTTLLVAQDGGLYGTTYVGGTNGNGVVYRFSPGAGLKVLHTFTAGPNDGAYPQGALIQTSDGNFYGTTAGGGANGNYGTVYKMTTNGIVTLLHSFNYSDGENPATALFSAGGGLLYGVIVLGGTNDSGSIFRVSTKGSFVQLHDFAASGFYSNIVTGFTTYTNDDGIRPYGTLLSGNDGWLYGTTQQGGTNGNGTIFRYNTNSGAFKVLHTFSQNPNNTNWDGASPTAGLTLFSNGVFWGTAAYGGTNGNGTIFQITTNGAYTVLHTFDINTDGSGVFSSLTRGKDGNFYGTADYGSFWSGMAYQFNTNYVMNVLHYFDRLDIVQNDYGYDGSYPVGGVTFGNDGYLYGTTTGYGANTNGTIYQIINPGLSISSLPGNQVLIYWPTNQSGFTLQINTNIATATWVTATPAPSVLNDQYVVTNSANAAGKKSFYRLKK
jgi:uncharacterized repeat protein (TIGR03803 family)